MSPQSLVYMDYKNIYDLFLGKNSNKDIKKSPDIDAEIGVMQSDFLNDSWYQVPFTVTAAGYYEVGDKHYTRRANVETYEILYTVSGRGTVTLGDEVFECTPNTVFLLNCIEPHTFTVKKGETWEYKHLHFTPNGVAKNVADRVAFKIMPDSGVINSVLDTILKELHRINVDSHFILSHNVSAILTYMIKFQFKSSFTDPQEVLIKRAVDYIHAHYMEKINIKQLAEDEFISPYHFIRLFKKYYGVPPYNYLVDYRLKQAQYLFLQQKSVNEVAVECGFSSTNSFRRAFQNKFGIVPSQYRENVANQMFNPEVEIVRKKGKLGE